MADRERDSSGYNICLSFIGGSAVSSITAWITAGHIRVDDDYLKLAEQYPVDLESVLPEPQEMAGFVLFWIFYAVAFLALYFLFDRKHREGAGIHDNFVYIVGTMLTVTGFTVLLFAEKDKFYVNMSWFMDWKIAVVITVSSAMAFYLSVKYDFALLCDILSWGLICVSALFCYVRNPLFGTNAFHFNGYFTTIYNVYNGAALGVDSNVIYGTYAYLFLPIFKIVGLSFSSYAAATMVMCVIIMGCEWYIIRNLINNPIIRFLTLSGCIYINIFFAVNAHYEQFITQHFPMRILFPMIMISYVLFFSKKGKLMNRRCFITGIIICCLSFMMNLESAVTTCLTWASACFYFSMAETNDVDRKQKIEKGVKVALQCIGGIIIALVVWVATVESISFIRAKEVLKISELYSTQVVFSKIGYGMLPLPEHIHVYMFVFIVYAIFLGVAIKQIFWGIDGFINKIDGQAVFALSVAGILMLIYYMGRTHNRSLFTWLCPCLILLSFILQKAINIIKRGHAMVQKVCAAVISTMLFMCVSIYGTSGLYVLNNSELFQDYISRQVKNNYDDYINEEIELLHKYSDKGTVNYLGNYAAGIALAADVHNNFLGEMAECWYSWDDYEYIEVFLEKCDGNIVIDGTAVNHIKTYIPDTFLEIMEKKGYEVIDSSAMSVVYGRVSESI